MKSIKCLLLFVVLIFPVTLVLCQSTGKSKIEAAANDYVNKLSADVELTDLQKKSINKSVVRYFTEQTNARENKETEKQKSLILSSDSIFTLQIDSILSREQREAVAAKAKQRGEQAVNANKKK